MSQKTTVAVIVMLTVMLLLAIYLSIAGKRRAKEQESSAVSTAAAETEPLIVPAAMPERFSMQIPSGFTETHSDYIDTYYIRNDASIIVTGEKIVIPGEQLEQYTKEMKEQYERSADEFTIVREEQILLEGNLPCNLIEFSYALIGENARQDFRCITAVTLKDNRSYIVTCKSRAETFGGYYQNFRDAVKSIRIADEPVSGTQAAATETVSVTAATTAA